VTLTFADGSIKNKWLRVTVLPTARTGLAAPDVFYFGNLCGETGNDAGAAAVTAVDLVMVRRSFTAAGTTVPVTNKYDFNRDGKVNATDLVFARLGAAGGTLTRLTAPAPAASGVAAAGSASTTQPVAAAQSLFSQSPVPAQTSGGATPGTTKDILGTASGNVLALA
jgi:hypothetical protein